MKAINFSLPDQNGQVHRLSDYLGHFVILYFYPKDDTSGCTIEACSFRDAIEEFKKKNVVILGVSNDSVESHKRFSDKYHLNFPILSNGDGKIIEVYKAWGRKTYLIDPKGKVAKVYEKVNPLIHSSQILKDLDILNKI